MKVHKLLKNITDVTYIVLNDHTLGYVFPHENSIMGVLKGAPDSGNPFPEPKTVTNQDNIRIATAQDFADFMVCEPKKHNQIDK